MTDIIPYGRQYLDEEDINAVVEVLQSSYLTTGPTVEQFEQAFAARTGAKYAVAVSSGTAALHLACMAAGLGKGDEVITTPMTFAASTNCALYVGAKPVFADINPVTASIDPVEIEKKITDKTRAIIPVHYTGLPSPLQEIYAIADNYNLIVIEDACHALGARYKDTTIGDCKYSDMAVFSFHPVKHITTGEGGMITTNSENLYRKLKMLRSHGITRDEDALKEKNHGGWYYEMQCLGFNYRMTDIQAALGISQLGKLEWFVNRRREIAAIYNQEFKKLPFELPMEPEGYFNSYHLYTIRLKNQAPITRRQLYDKLRKKNVYTQVHYIPVHTFPYYKEKFQYKWGDYPVAENHYKRVLSLPIFPGMTDEDIKYVVTSVKEVLV